MMGRKLDTGTASAPEGAIPWLRHVVFGVVCALVIGIFAWSAEPGFLELMSPRAEDSYYNLLVQGFRAGQLNVKRAAPPGLAQLADPYDTAMNTSYVWDTRYPSYEMSYYQGKLYLYFGVTPALVLFWPYVALTGHYLSHKHAVVIFYTVGFLVAAGLIRAVWRRYFPEVSVWVAAAGILALGLATGILEDLSRCDVHEVPVSCGYAFAMLALAAIWRALHEPRRRVGWLLLASLAYGLAVGARQSLLFGIIILLLPVAQAWRAATEPGSRGRVRWLLLAAVGPAMLIGLGLMLYNFLRFDNPFEFGWHYQMTSDKQVAARQFSLHYLWFNFRFYFLEPMRWRGHFPFLQAIPLSSWPSGYGGIGERYSGILMNYPVVCLALAAPLAWRGRPAEVISVLRGLTAAVFLLFTICALTLCLFFIGSSKYELDFLPVLMLLAVIGIFGLERALMGSPVWRHVARWGWCLLLAYSVAFNVLASVEAHATANYFTGNALLHQGRVDEAVAHFQKALALWPESATFHSALGNALCQKGQVDEAIIQNQKALALQPKSADAYEYLGEALFQKGHVDEAIIQYQKALEIKPDFPEAHNNLGGSLLQLGRVNEAITHFQRAVEIKPNFAEANNNIGFSLLQIGQVNEAIPHFQRAVEIKPDFAEAHYNLGDSLLQLGRVDEAIVHYRKVIELQPRLPQAYNDLGDAFRRKAMAAEAMACYQKAIELQPQFIPAQMNLAWMLATWPEPSVRNGGKAVALAGQANQFSKGKDPLILRTLAAAYAETGRFPEAVMTAKRALALALAQSNPGLTNALQTEIGLYQTNSPCRSTNN
jgi:tetratricopeptide (TPR) repeat protein